MEKQNKELATQVAPTNELTRGAQPPTFQLSAQPVQMQTDPETDTFEVPWNDTEMDQYQKLSGYGNGSSGTALNSVEYVVLHSTGGSSTLSSVDAHFEVATDGTIYLANDLTKQCPHAGHKYQRQAGHKFNPYKDMNKKSHGIEFVNDYHTLSNQAKSTTDTAKIQAMRTEIQGLDLAPQFKQSLLNLSDKDLISKMKGTSYVIYEDISPEQKKAAYEMYRNMQQDNPDAEFIAHEHVAPKKVGEGASIQEFLETIDAYNGKLTQLRAVAPEFWDYEQPQKGTLQQQAERAMSQTQFFAEFYAINARADRLLELFGSMGGSATQDLIPHLQSEGEKATGMYGLLGKFKQYAVQQEILDRNFSVNVTVNQSQDWWGGEDTYVTVNGGLPSGNVTLENGQSNSFTFSNRKIIDSLSLGKASPANIQVSDADDIGANDLLMSLKWNPLTNPAGITQSNSNYSVTVCFE